MSIAILAKWAGFEKSHLHGNFASALWAMESIGFAIVSLVFWLFTFENFAKKGRYQESHCKR
jgi:hypothetical protein